MVSVAFALALPNHAALPARDPAPAPAPPAFASVTLRVSGGMPLRMQAALLAEGNSWSLGTAAWHEVTLYRRESEEFAVAITTFKKSSSENDVFRAELFPNLEEALRFLEAFDPTADLTVDLDASDRSVSAADIALRAAALRQRTDEITRQYQALVGEMLFRIGSTG